MRNLRAYLEAGHQSERRSLDGQASRSSPQRGEEELTMDSWIDAKSEPASASSLYRAVDGDPTRIQLDASAAEFLLQQPRIREGDYCLIGGFPTRVTNISSEGKWTYFSGRNVTEPFRVPPSDDVQRL